MSGDECADGAHEWGPVERSRLAGTLHRPCLNCRVISLDLSDELDDGGDE